VRVVPEFDEASHTYTLDGRVLPSVSEIIAPLKNFDGIPASVMRKAQDRGKAVHKAAELHDIGRLGDMGRHKEILLPYLEAWKAFRASQDWEWLDIEQPLANPTLGFAGTRDRMGIRRSMGKKAKGIVDIKATAADCPVTGIQIGGYELLEPEEDFEVRIGVRLLPDGTFRVTNYQQEVVMFRSCLNVFNFKKKHGI